MKIMKRTFTKYPSSYVKADREDRFSRLNNYRTSHTTKQIEDTHKQVSEYQSQVNSLLNKINPLRRRIYELLDTANEALSAGVNLQKFRASNNEGIGFATEIDKLTRIDTSKKIQYLCFNPYITQLDSSVNGHWDASRLFYLFTNGVTEHLYTISGIGSGGASLETLDENSRFSKYALLTIQGFLDDFDDFENRFYSYIDEVTA